MKSEIIVKALILASSGRCLLTLTNSKFEFDLPGGKALSGSLSETLKNKVYEDLQLDVNVILPIGVRHSITLDITYIENQPIDLHIKEEKIDVHTIYFVCIPIGGEIQLSRTLNNFIWIDLWNSDELKALPDWLISIVDKLELVDTNFLK